MLPATGLCRGAAQHWFAGALQKIANEQLKCMPHLQARHRCKVLQIIYVRNAVLAKVELCVHMSPVPNGMINPNEVYLQQIVCVSAGALAPAWRRILRLSKDRQLLPALAVCVLRHMTWYFKPAQGHKNGTCKSAAVSEITQAGYAVD
jgi:hypothetical protein